MSRMEFRPECPAQRAAGVVRAYREVESGVQSVAPEKRDEARHAFARAAQGVDIDLEAYGNTLEHANRRQGSRDSNAEALGRLCA